MADPSAPPIALDACNWTIVQGILQSQLPHMEVWAFGSRARGTPKPYSDLDLALITSQPLPLSMLAQLNDAFDGSDLTIKVDLVDWASTSESFRSIIARYKVLIQSAVAPD
jgi:type I restriction enzyme S subunit